jgi:hypothetical protein
MKYKSVPKDLTLGWGGQFNLANIDSDHQIVEGLNTSVRTPQ